MSICWYDDEHRVENRCRQFILFIYKLIFSDRRLLDTVGKTDTETFATQTSYQTLAYRDWSRFQGQPACRVHRETAEMRGCARGLLSPRFSSGTEEFLAGCRQVGEHFGDIQLAIGQTTDELKHRLTRPFTHLCRCRRETTDYRTGKNKSKAQAYWKNVQT